MCKSIVVIKRNHGKPVHCRETLESWWMIGSVMYGQQSTITVTWALSQYAY